jgi:hypothetical protein
VCAPTSPNSTHCDNCCVGWRFFTGAIAVVSAVSYRISYRRILCQEVLVPISQFQKYSSKLLDYLIYIPYNVIKDIRQRVSILIRRCLCMATMKDQWVSGREAAEIMTRLNGHSISPDYVRLLSRNKRIRSKAIDGRTNVYHRGDVEACKVKAKKKIANPPLEDRSDVKEDVPVEEVA